VGAFLLWSLLTVPRWGQAHPNSIFNTVIRYDPDLRRAYNSWLKRIQGDVAAVNRWAHEQGQDGRRPPR
jgi:hypothetical protein